MGLLRDGCKSSLFFNLYLVLVCTLFDFLLETEIGFSFKFAFAIEP